MISAILTLLNSFRVGIFLLSLGGLAHRTYNAPPWGVRAGGRRNRIDPHGGEIVRLGTRTWPTRFLAHAFCLFTVSFAAVANLRYEGTTPKTPRHTKAHQEHHTKAVNETITGWRGQFDLLYACLRTCTHVRFTHLALHV